MIPEMTECMRNHKSHEARGLARRKVKIASNDWVCLGLSHCRSSKLLASMSLVYIERRNVPIHTSLALDSIFSLDYVVYGTFVCVMLLSQRARMVL
jgi:hypothetical protein